jgi:hemolysin III
MRGWLHTFMIPVAVVAAVALVAAARSWPTRLAAAVFVLSTVVMLVTSSLFNRVWWSDRSWRIMRQLDQTSIYLLIGGTATGLLAVAGDGDIRVWPITIVWILALAGIAIRWAPFELPKGVQSSLFVALGLFAGLRVWSLFDEVSTSSGWLVVIGGALYSSGVLVLGLRRPDPWPRTFGYHEIWHVMVVVAITLHYIAVVQVVT